jgi:hypothetical protein
LSPFIVPLSLSFRLTKVIPRRSANSSENMVYGTSPYRSSSCTLICALRQVPQPDCPSRIRDYIYSLILPALQQSARTLPVLVYISNHLLSASYLSTASGVTHGEHGPAKCLIVNSRRSPSQKGATKLKDPKAVLAYGEETPREKYSGQLIFYRWIVRVRVSLLGDMTRTHQNSLVALQIRVMFFLMPKICSMH